MIDARGRGGGGNGSADEKEEAKKKKKKKADVDDDDDDAKKTTPESFVTEDELRREIERLETETTRRERFKNGSKKRENSRWRQSFARKD